MLDNQTSRHARLQVPPSRLPRVLCVDDDPDLHTAISLRLGRYELELDHAFYGMHGITEAIDVLPDVILLDLAMPRGNGEYLLEWIMRNPETSNIPVLVLTGMRDRNLKRRVLGAGASAYLSKPVDYDELLHQLSRFIDIRERRSEDAR